MAKASAVDAGEFRERTSVSELIKWIYIQCTVLSDKTSHLGNLDIETQMFKYFNHLSVFSFPKEKPQ